MKATGSSKLALKEEAMALFNAGRFKEACSCFTKICQRMPKDADAWFLLGIIHGQLGELENSERCSRKATRLAPASFAAWDNLGLSLMLQGKRSEAKKCFKQALQVNPSDEQAYNNLGTLLRDEGELDKAGLHYRRAIEIKPDYSEAYNNLGNLLHDRSQIREALSCYEKAIQLDPAYVDAHYNRGMAQQKMGKYDAALMSYQGVLRLMPGHVDAITGIANIYEKQREYDRAYEVLEPLISSGRVSVSTAITFASVARRLNKYEQAIALMEGLLNAGGLTLSQQQELHFNLGALYDDEKKYEQAFAHFQKGNTLRPYPEEPTSQPAYFSSIIEVFSADRFTSHARAINDSERPIFIVGMPRSGTSLVEQILSSHPDVHGGGELRDVEETMKLLQKTVGGKPYPHMVADLTSEMLEAAAQSFLERLNEISLDSLRVTDKMPHNFLYLGLIAMMFPMARIIHCARDPLDTCLSIYFHNFNANHPYTTNLLALGAYYRQYQHLMHHWESVAGIPIYTVRYEKLVENQEVETRGMLDFCGLEWDSACLRFHENRRVVTTPSYHQVRKPMYKTAVQRWKNYEPYLKPLIDALGEDYV